MDKEWVRNTVEEQINAIYGLKDPSGGDVEKMVAGRFSNNPVLQFPGFRELNPLFGCYQGTALLKEHYKGFYDAIEVLGLEKQYIIVDGFGASAHFAAELKFKGSGSVYDLELVALVEPDMEGRVRDLKLYFDTSTFQKAFKTPNARFKDVRGIMPHPGLDPRSPHHAGAIMADAYNAFGRVYLGTEDWDTWYDLFADDMEVIFKSNVDLLPYAGQYSGKEGFKQWLKKLFSIWSLNSFNFTKTYAEGNIADFAMHELHYYDNPDGSRRYLDVYIVQNWITDGDGKIHLFKSYHDSAWLDETFLASKVYKDHYGYPENYAR